MSRLSLQGCRQALAVATPNEREHLLRQFAEDERSSVRSLAAAARRADARSAAELRRLSALMDHQSRLHADGYAVVAGVDEVGRGALAGPVTACAVVLAAEVVIEGLNDSKKLTPEQRVRVAARIADIALATAVAHCEPDEIDRLGIGEATRLAMRRAILSLSCTVHHVLVDGNDGRVGFPSTAVIGGDSRCACIAAASVLAKVTRDALMVELDSQFPGYGLAGNKGYGTTEHVEAVRQHGPSPIHRRSFAPCGGTIPLL